jgi:hypothetical protein
MMNLKPPILNEFFRKEIEILQRHLEFFRIEIDKLSRNLAIFGQRPSFLPFRGLHAKNALSRAGRAPDRMLETENRPIPRPSMIDNSRSLAQFAPVRRSVSREGGSPPACSDSCLFVHPW